MLGTVIVFSGRYVDLGTWTLKGQRQWPRIMSYSTFDRLWATSRDVGLLGFPSKPGPLI